MQPTSRLPGLDGLRALAALAVVLGHIVAGLVELGIPGTPLGSDLVVRVPLLKDFASLSVTVFFSLSGFLITYLFLMEERLRLVQVRTFYMRRILRIWPLYYTYMVGSGLLLWHFGEQIDWPAVGLSALLFANLSPLLSLSPMLIFHYWSLGVEEQFYLFYPWLFRLRRWRWHIISGLCLLFIGLNGWLVVSFGGKHGPHTSYKIHYAYLLIGALGAGAYHRGWHRFFLHRSIQLGTWLLLGVMAAYTTPLHSFIWVHELLACFTVLLIWGQATGRGIISLEWRPLRFLGRISFGIYILHPAVIFVVTRYWRVLGYTSWIDYACVFGLIFGLTILLASLSYQYLEAPFLRMKRHYA